jgi:hypothetical protein
VVVQKIKKKIKHKKKSKKITKDNRKKVGGNGGRNARSVSFEREMYRFICRNVPFIKSFEVKNFYMEKYKYTRQHIYQTMNKLIAKGWLLRGEGGYLVIPKNAPVVLE